jgi:predicted PurR-regulated permease PerM
MDNPIRVTITPVTVLTTLLIGTGAYVLWTLRGLALLVLTAIIIASAMEPGVMWFKRHGVHRTFAVTLMYLSVFGTLFGLIYFFFPF